MKYGSIVSGDPSFVALFNAIGRQMDAEQEFWVKNLRALGVKASHPNDGWIDRENNTLVFMYPQFNDGADVGDLVALGWPDAKCWLVRLTSKTEITSHNGRWSFDVVSGRH